MQSGRSFRRETVTGAPVCDLGLRAISSARGVARVAGACLAALAVVAGFDAPVAATHFRYAHVTWIPSIDSADPNAIDFTVQGVWRRDTFSTDNNRCIDPATLADMPCRGAGGFAGVGDLVHEQQGRTRFDPGDTTGLIGGPPSLRTALLYLVTSVDVDDNWAFGLAVDPTSLPGTCTVESCDTAITHVYPGPGNYVADVDDCCRISECVSPNAHMNNPDDAFSVETRVNVGTGNSSPVSTLPPIVLCPRNGLCTFSVPVSDNELHPVTFRLSTVAEAGLDFQPGPTQCPNAASIDPSTGVYTWDTTGCTWAGDPPPVPPDGGCGDLDLNTLYSTQVMIEEQSGASRVAVDFLVKLESGCGVGPNDYPVFDAPVCASSMSVNPGVPLVFTVQASDPNTADSVELNGVGLPTGAAMNPSLPVSGQPPVSSDFSWTPTVAHQGQHVVAFTATDQCGAQSLCSITVDVSWEVCDDGVDNDSDGLADCQDPDCDATPCNDGQFCTVNDLCQAGSCSGAPRDCDDGNQCTVSNCDEAGDTCIDDGAAANGTTCEDGEFCTAGDTCSAGLCIAGLLLDCSSFDDDCNLGVCNEGADQCEPQPTNEGGDCDDGQFCTVGEACALGMCEGSAPRDCDDGNSCTADICDEAADECTSGGQPNCCGNGTVEPSEGCDDGNQFGGDGCEADCTVSTACDFTHPGTPGELFVGGCGTPSFGDVQSAVSAAQDGDVISICPGTYAESVQVTKEVTIRSTAGPASTTLHAAIGAALDVRRSAVRIEGLTLISDAAAAIEASAICPLGQSSCGSPGGSNLTIVDNVIENSPTGIGWQSKIDCVAIRGNALSGNGAHIALVRAAGSPSILVEIGGEAGGGPAGNTLTGGGSSGAALRVVGTEVRIEANTVEDSAAAGIVVSGVSSTTPVTIAANTVRNSAAAGIAVSGLPDLSQVVENSVTGNGGDGITIGAGAAATNVEDNNIAGNSVGLGNEATGGTVAAARNWWGSQTGPSGVSWTGPAGETLTGAGDSIENRGGAATDFIPFLCRSFPEGFENVDGVCSTETAELRQLMAGRSPDLDPFGRFIVFESTANMNVDPRSASTNEDGSREIFLLDRRLRRKWGPGVCLGGLTACDFNNIQSCTQCSRDSDCAGDPEMDPITLNGECVFVTQITDYPTVLAESSAPRITGRGRAVFYASTADQAGSNPDGSQELLRWERKLFEKVDAAGPHDMLTSGAAGQTYDAPAPSLSGRFVATQSDADPTGFNPDGNTEIFRHAVRKGQWVQITQTTGFCTASGGECASDLNCEGPGDACQVVENLRPSTVDGRRVVFDSTGDLQTGNNKLFPSRNNSDHNREIFVAKVRRKGVEITQITDTAAPVENFAATGDTRAKLIAFSSNGDFTAQNPDGNREIFVWFKKTLGFEQVTDSAGGESANPVISTSGRWLVFESTADLDQDGATNRRVFQYDRDLRELLTLSRVRFGTNRLPRIRRRRYVTWESTSDLTGSNPGGEWVIYMFDRKKDD